MGISIDVMNPVAELGTEITQKVSFDGDLEGKVIGFLDNRKPNAKQLFEQLGEYLKTEHGIAGYKILSKENAATPASDEIIQELSDECDLVITGSGD